MENVNQEDSENKIEVSMPQTDQKSIKKSPFNLKIILLLCVLLLIAFIGSQYYQQKNLKQIICGNYRANNMECPLGTICQRIGPARYLDGKCKTYLSSFLDTFSNEYRQQMVSKPLPEDFTKQTTPVPTVDETANWKTYTNEKFYYQMQYPNGITIKEIADGDYIEIHVPNQAEYLSIQFLELSRELDKQKEFDKQTYRPWGANFVGETQFAGNDALLFSTSSAQLTIDAPNLQGKSFTKYEVFLKSQSKRIHIEYFGDGETKKLFDQILSTFRFIDKNNTSYKLTIFSNPKDFVDIYEYSENNMTNQGKEVYSLKEVDKDGKLEVTLPSGKYTIFARCTSLSCQRSFESPRIISLDKDTIVTLKWKPEY